MGTQKLSAVLEEKDAEKAADELGALIEADIEPLMSRVVRARLRRHGVEHEAHLEDIVSDAVVRFLLHVEEIRAGRAEKVERLEAFATMLATRR